jgi:hypothetical protein
MRLLVQPQGGVIALTEYLLRIYTIKTPFE